MTTSLLDQARRGRSRCLTKKGFEDLGLLQVKGVEAFGEPAVDQGE
jgi:hypothetical protein